MRKLPQLSLEATFESYTFQTDAKLWAGSRLFKFSLANVRIEASNARLEQPLTFSKFDQSPTGTLVSPEEIKNCFGDHSRRVKICLLTSLVKR